MRYAVLAPFLVFSVATAVVGQPAPRTAPGPDTVSLFVSGTVPQEILRRAGTDWRQLTSAAERSLRRTGIVPVSGRQAEGLNRQRRPPIPQFSVSLRIAPPAPDAEDLTFALSGSLSRSEWRREVQGAAPAGTLAAALTQAVDTLAGELASHLAAHPPPPAVTVDPRHELRGHDTITVRTSIGYPDGDRRWRTEPESASQAGRALGLSEASLQALADSVLGGTAIPVVASTEGTRNQRWACRNDPSACPAGGGGNVLPTLQVLTTIGEGGPSHRYRVTLLLECHHHVGAAVGWLWAQARQGTAAEDVAAATINGAVVELLEQFAREYLAANPQLRR